VGRRGRRIPHSRRERVEYELSLEELLAEHDHARRWAGAFGKDRPLRVEIGVGNSDFLIRLAEIEPDYNYLGFEYSPKRVFKFLRRVKARGIETIRILRTEAVLGLKELVLPGTLDSIFILFPDPWPKRRHAKHRLVQPPAMALLSSLLAPGGRMSLRSDDAAYAAQMLEVLDAEPLLENLSGQGRFSPAPRHEIHTAYELKYRKEGRAIRNLEYRRREG